MNIDEDLWALIRSDFTDVEYYVNNAPEPAFLIVTNDRIVQLLVNTVGEIGRYSSQKKAKARLREIVESANIPIRVYSKTRWRGKKLFAENKVSRIKIPLKEGAPHKVFEIPEWRSIIKEEE